MADFLLVVGDGTTAERWFATGLATARAHGAGEPAATLVRDDLRIAAWHRRAGAPGARLVQDPAPNGRWLLASGTWWGAAGLHHGNEGQLLDRITSTDLERTVARLDGFFALATGDGTRVRVATDAIGSHHVHARSAAGATAVAGSALWLAALDPTPLDPIGCQELLSTGVIYEDRTPWAEVRALPPASIVDVTARGTRDVRRWWSIDSLEPESLHGDAAVDAFGAAMLDACASIGRAHTSLVSDLTGGWDSRLLAGFLLRAGVPFATTVAGPPQSPDVVLSRRIASAIGLAHHPFSLGGLPTADEVLDGATLTDGLVNAIGYARVLRVHRELCARFGASLNGSFGEVARGYWWEILSPSPDSVGALDPAVIARLRYAGSAPRLDLWPARERLDPIPHFTDLVARIDGQLPGHRPRSFRLDHTYLRLRMRSWQGRIASSTDRLWPCLSPMMARPALEALLRTATRDRCRDRFARRVLARHAPKLAAMPLEQGGPALPRTWRNAWRFAPELLRFAQKVARRATGRRAYATTLEETSAPRLALWQDERIGDLLDPDRMVLAEHVDRDALRRTIAEMRQPVSTHDLTFGNLLALEIALRRARDRPPTSTSWTGEARPR